MLRFYEDGSVTLKDPWQIKESQWADIAGCACRTGYGITSAEEAEKVYSRLALAAPGGEYRFNGDMAAALRGEYGIHTKEERHRAEEIAEAAEDYFGTTWNLSLAGWLTVNGKFLNFSGDGFQRDIDHRGIRQVLEDCGVEMHDEPGSNLSPLVYFMDEGNIRLMGNGADMSECPNGKQWAPLERYLCSCGDTAYIDLSARGSAARIATLEYARSEAALIRDDIERFFETGSFPRGRSV